MNVILYVYNVTLHVMKFFFCQKIFFSAGKGNFRRGKVCFMVNEMAIHIEVDLICLG